MEAVSCRIRLFILKIGIILPWWIDSSRDRTRRLCLTTGDAATGEWLRSKLRHKSICNGTERIHPTVYIN
jgi:hypothetical protein